MSLDIQQTGKEGIQVLSLRGRITLGEEATALRDHIRQLVDTGNTKAILNLAGVDYIDSTGLGALVMSATTLKRAGGEAKLLHLNRRTIELLVMTKLATIFDIFDDEQHAVNSFFPDRQLKRFDILSFVQSTKKA